MAKISQYPDGGILTPTDQVVIARSGANRSIYTHGTVQFITPVAMVDTLGTTWSGYAAPVASYNFNLQDANHNLPAGITGAIVICSALWAAANTVSRIEFYPKGGATAFVQVRAMVANIYNDQQGIVQVGTDDDISVQVFNANAGDVYLTLLGYIT